MIRLHQSDLVSHFMQKRISFALLFGLAIFTQDFGILAAHSEVVLGLEPWLALKTLYPKARGHKAMALGPGGIMQISDNKGSAEIAERIALRTCNETVRYFNFQKYGKCELVAVDDRTIWNKPPVGQPLDEPLPLPDMPLAKAKIFPAQSGAPKGIVLAIHGSGSAFGVSSAPGPFENSWFKYFNSIGFEVVFPSAFDDVFPAYEYAGWWDPATYARTTRMALMRVAQTKRTISELKKSHPGLPIYLWSHSAGGNIAQSIHEGIAGAIIVETNCGLGSPQLNAIPQHVSVLYVYGTNSDKIIKGRSKLSLSAMKRRCGPAYQTRNRQIVMAQGDGHMATIWHQDVLDAVNRLFGRPRFELRPPRGSYPLSPEARLSLAKGYKFSALKKAFAVGKTDFAWIGGYATQEQATLEALLECNRRATGFSYPPSGHHECVVYLEGNANTPQPQP